MRDGYSTLYIGRAFGIPRERLREWLNRGFIKPSIQKASGPGTKALFAREDLYRMMLFKQILESGFTREIASVLAHTVTSGKIMRGDFVSVGYNAKRSEEDRRAGYTEDLETDLEDDEIKRLVNETESDAGMEDIMRLIPKRIRERYSLFQWKRILLLAQKIRNSLLDKLAGGQDHVIVINMKRLRKQVDVILAK
ncbi:MAG: MerR family transcriptional regulator [Desulfobacteraceae bacterium]|jgi:hypothetical protein